MSTPLWTPGTLKQPGDLVRPTSAGSVTPQGPDNPFFDDGATGWTFSGDGNAVINTAAPVFNGAYSLKANDTGGNNQKVATNNARLPVQPGQIVTIRCYVQCTGDADRTRIQPRINWYTSGAVLISPSVLATDPSIIGDGFARVTPGLGNSGGLVGLAAVGVWVLLEVTGTAPPDSATWTPAVAFNWGPDGAWACDYFTWEYASQAAPNNNLYRAVQAAAGFTANIEPDWPTTIGQTIVDNEVTWECVSGNSVTWQAHRILVSGDTEPVWPLVVNAAVADNTISWTLNSRRVVDAHVPQSKIGMLGAKKIFSPDEDIINFSATVNPLDWTTVDDAGFLPFGLQVYGANPVAAMGLYRGNLAAFNSQGCQIWQIDPDPAAMALLDAVPVPCTYPKSLSPVGDDLALLTNLGIRSLALTGSSINLQGGYFGKQVDLLVVPKIAEVEISGYEPLGLYWPAQGQYWLFFEDEAFVLTITGPKPENKSWSRYTFPWTVDHWTLLGTDLYLRAGDLVEKVDPTALYDDIHTEFLDEPDFRTTDVYGTSGWAAAASQIVVGGSQQHADGESVWIFGPPLPLPVLFVTATTVPSGANNRAIIASYDNGLTWTGLATPVNNQTFTSCAYSRARGEILFAAVDGTILRCTDGVTLADLPNNLGSVLFNVSDILRNAADTLYIACANGAIATSPTGEVWTDAGAPARTYTRLFNGNDGTVFAGSASTVTQPMAISVDTGLTWALQTAMGFSSTVYELAQSLSGQYEFGARTTNFSIKTTDLATFAQVSVGASQIMLTYDPSNDVFVAGTGISSGTFGILTCPGTGVQAWTGVTTVDEYFDIEDLCATYTGGVIGIRLVGGGTPTQHLIVRADDPTVTGSWSNIAPAAFSATAVYTRIHEFALEGISNPVNTGTFVSRTVNGGEGDTDVTASAAVLGYTGDALIVKYPADGPFTPVAADNVVDSETLTIPAPGLTLYLKQGTVLRITRAGGTDWNYLAADVASGATVLPLVYPLEHVAVAVRVHPVGTVLLNANDNMVSYVVIELAADVLADTAIELVSALPADADDLPMIIRPLQRTLVAGGQGTSHVTLEDVTEFANPSVIVPEVGLGAAPVVVGPLVEFTAWTDFVGEIQWPFLDLNNFNANKELQAFDLSCQGICTVAFGWDQKFPDFDDSPTGTWTQPYEVDGDTVPGNPVPYTLTGSSFAMRLVFDPGQAWVWYSANMYVQDETK